MSAATSTTKAANGTTQDAVRVRVWDLVVRSTHWLIALSIAVLSVTGVDIGHPFLVSPLPAADPFTTGMVRVVHFYAAIVFSLAVLSRLLWMFVGRGHATWREFIPVTPERRAGLGSTLKFYLFLRRTPATSVGHNPLAGLSYVVVFGLYLVMIMTGAALYSVDAPHSPLGFANMFLPLFGGITGARWIHHVVMWLLIGFFVHHLYSAILTSVVERNGTMESIFTGSKWLPRKLAEEDRAAREAKK